MQLFEDRRALHRIPECARNLPKTAQYLTDSLKGLRCRVFSPMEGAVCAYFDFDAPGTIAFRADMDGLRVEEKTGLSFASEHNGFMHACGHDGHMAILLALARRVDQNPVDKNILLIFQPDEEGAGGAKDLCQTGILERYAVKVIFGLHLWPGLEKGMVYSRRGEMMSRSGEVTLAVQGKSAHIGKAEQGRDALAACIDFYIKAAAMEKETDPRAFRLLKFGRMEGGTVRNAVAETAHLEGSLRTFDDGVFARMKEKLEKIAQQVQEASGCTLSLHISEGYPAVCNPDAVYEKVKRITRLRELEKPTLITEDFSWYQRRVPGMFFFLGIGDTPALHAADFDFDETVLRKGAELFERLARHYR